MASVQTTSIMNCAQLDVFAQQVTRTLFKSLWSGERLNEGSYCFIVMELCNNNFEQHLDECHRRQYTIWDWWFYNKKGIFSMELELDILSGLVFIHSMNEVHRDLKPANGTLTRYPFPFCQY